MVSVAQLAEHQVVALVVVGSSPITHPKRILQWGPIVQWLGLRFFEPATGVQFSLGLQGKKSSSGLFFLFRLH